jgi:hypothetical protein
VTPALIEAWLGAMSQAPSMRIKALVLMHGIDFAGSTVRVRASYYAGHLTTPKSGKVRAVPLAPDVGSALARIGEREQHGLLHPAIVSHAQESAGSDASHCARHVQALGLLGGPAWVWGVADGRRRASGGATHTLGSVKSTNR